MSEFLTMMLSYIPDEKANEIEQAQLLIQQQVGLEQGYKSLSIWRDCDFPGYYAALFHYEDVPGMPNLLDRMIESGLLAQLTQQEPSVADAHPMIIHTRHGLEPGKTQIGHYLSSAIRKAAPGYTDELLTEISYIIEGLKLLDGYLGSAYGPNSRLDEEVISLAFWTDRHSFQTSMPTHSPYEIRLFERML